MEWLAEFGKWFGLVVLAFGGPAFYQHYISPGSTVRRNLTRSERRIRELREITERFERLQVEQRLDGGAAGCAGYERSAASRGAATALRGPRRARERGAPGARLDHARMGHRDAARRRRIAR